MQYYPGHVTSQSMSTGFLTFGCTVVTPGWRFAAVMRTLFLEVWHSQLMGIEGIDPLWPVRAPSGTADRRWRQHSSIGLPLGGAPIVA